MCSSDKFANLYVQFNIEFKTFKLKELQTLRPANDKPQKKCKN